VVSFSEGRTTVEAGLKPESRPAYRPREAFSS
jgi:hypothetical protein